MSKFTHAFTVDVEDWYHGIELPKEDWADKERRLQLGLDILLALLDDNGVRATFFVLGVVAEDHPQLVRKIAEAGHEIGSHGYDHTKVYELDKKSFYETEVRTRDLLEEIAGVPVIAYRAPFFSITRRSLWALEVLADLGYHIDSSIMAVETWRYGIEGAPEEAYKLSEFGLTEIPPSSMSFLGRHLGLGGAYFRIFPYWLTKLGLDRKRSQGQPAVFYIHPWEYDPSHPRIHFEWKAKMTHYARLGRTVSLTTRLLSEYNFSTLGELMTSLSSGLSDYTIADLTRGVNERNSH